MTLRIAEVPAARGALWVRRSFTLFFRHPLGFSMLFMLFLVAALILMALPFIGALLLLAVMPLLTLGFAAATRAAEQGQPVHAGALFEPFKPGTDAQRRNALLRLCLLYAALTAATLLLAQSIDGGAFERVQLLLGAQRTEANQREIEAVIADPGLFNGMLVRLVLLGLISVPFWHAPMLVAWQGQSLAQSLFSSALACWRNRGAFFVYLLAWAGVSAAIGLAVSIVVALAGGQALAALMLPPVALLLSVAFYVSLYFMYAESFAATDRTEPEAPALQR
jgi:hypothetical protein